MASKHEATTAALEIGVFRRFAASAGLTVEGEIEQPNPPDILCSVQGLGRVAFELVRLDDSDELQRMGYFQRTNEFWKGAMQQAAPGALANHSAAQINVFFEAGANQAQRKAAMEAVVAALSALPTDAQGEVFDPLPPGVESAELRHFASIKGGPCLREFSGRHIRFEEAKDAPIGIDLGRIDAKIAKYKEGWCARAELLAFARWGTPFSDQQHRAPEYLAKRLPAGIFQRGWIFEVASQIVVACAPR